MFRSLIAVLLTLGMSSCALTPVRDRGCAHPASARDYFGEESDDMDFYAKAFAKMGEPSLSCATKHTKAWRLTYHRYNRPMVTIRATERNGVHTIEVVEFRISYHENDRWTGRIVRSRERSLTAQEWNEIDAAAVEVDFWRKPVNYTPDLCDQDGETCRVPLHVPESLVEGRADKFHAVLVWPAGSLHGLEDILIRLAGLND